MKSKLTPAMVLRAGCEPGKDRTIYWDAELKGFGLMVTAKGARSYVVQYRAGRRSRRATLSVTLGLNEAKREGHKILGEVAKGGDPVKADRDAQENMFREIAERYLTSRAARGLRSIAERRSILERLIYPKLGARPIESIKRSEVAALLEQIGDQRGPRMAGYAASVLQIVFHWFERQSDDFRSPMIRGLAPSGIVARDRVLDDRELRAFWKTAVAWQHPFARAMQVALLTGARRNEVYDMLRSEIVGGVWTIPAERYKTKVPHSIPLSAAAKAVIDSCPVLGTAGFVFTVNGRNPLRDSRAKSTFEHKMLGELRQIDPNAEHARWTIHDVRRTCATLLARAGVDPDVRERCLGHVIRGVAGTYNRHSYEEEKRIGFEKLATLIGNIVDPQPNVVAIARPRVPA
jgi:integrase